VLASWCDVTLMLTIGRYPYAGLSA
jgi:hypothetical protein